MSSALHANLQRSLNSRRERGSLRSLKSSAIDKTLHEFSSNDYLSLSTSGELRRQFEVYMHGESSLASTGSRLLSGNSHLANTIEAEARLFWEAEDALLCASGYEANVAIFSTVPQPGDTILYDELIHASVHVGMKHSRASRKLPFQHNNLQHLRALLRSEALRQKTSGPNSVFLAVETGYSMDGDRAPLPEILSVVRAELPNTHVIVDEAHATGPYGAGLVDFHSLTYAPEILIRLHTFGKGAGGTGSIILCDSCIKQYLLNYAKGLIYSTFPSTPALCLLRASLTLLSSQTIRSKRSDLWQRVDYLHSLLGTRTGITVPTVFESPIVPVFTTRALELSSYLETEGFRVLPVRYPTVAKGEERIRICLRSEIEFSVIKSLVHAIDTWRRLFVIGAVQTDEGSVQAGPKL